MATPVGRQAGKRHIADVHSHALFRQLRARRIALKISTQTLGKKLGYTYTTITRWETGVHIPSTLKFIDWANALGMDVILRSDARTLLAERPAPAAKEKLMAGRA